MTLVVGKIIDNEIIVESDSRISDPNRAQNDPLCGLLKTIIVIPHVCFSFAGNVHFAEKAVDRSYRDNFQNITDFLAMLWEIHIESRGQTDFAVASLLDSTPRLFRIHNYQLENDITSFWIGDKKGFEVFQRKFHEESDDKPEKDRYLRAFEKVLSEPSLPSIGDFHISVRTDFDIHSTPVFLYRESSYLEFSFPQQITCTGDWQPIPSGTTETGSYGICYFVTISPTHYGVAIHFPFGNFGIFFCPKLQIDPIKVKDVDGIQFANIIKERFDIPLRGLIKTPGENMEFQFIDTSDK